MTDLPSMFSTLAVLPVLFGPLQTLLALLPAILLGLGSMLFAAFKPKGFVKLVRFCWRQKLFLGCVAGVIVGWHYGVFAKLFESRRSIDSLAMTDGTDWSTARGGVRRLGRGSGTNDPTNSASVWKNDRDATVFSSPAVSGSRVFFSTATGLGPFSPEGRGAIVCADAESGREVWRYSPSDYRATFSSPVVADGCVVCGEGLHQVQDARVTCLDLLGQKRWEFRTKSHVESTAAIADGKVFIGAGDDGFYCLSLEPTADGQPRVLWHLEGDKYPDCESSPAVVEGVVYFGLGDAGFAICTVDVATGTERWRIKTPYPVFAPPTVAEGKLFLSTGNGNFVQSAADLMEMKLQVLRDGGATEQELAAARQRLQPAGEVWCIDLATQQVDWKFAARDAILGEIVRGDDSLFFGSRDGHVYRVSLGGELMSKRDLREPLVSSPALGQKHVYGTTTSGRLFCLESTTLQPVWDASLGSGENFISSPVVAHGHVYVGTVQQGLRCLGQPGKPEPPLWSRGERGGRADDDPVPDSLSLAWRYPAEGDAPFEITAPLMPLDGAIYAVGIRDGKTEVLKLSMNDADSMESRLLWHTSLEGPINVAPVGCGERVCVIVDHDWRMGTLARPDGGTGKSAHPPALVCLSSNDGRELWSRSLSGESAGMSVDASRLVVWSSKTQLECFDLASSDSLWNVTVGDSSSVGAPTIAHDIVFAATQTHLVALDAPTGALLWKVRLSEKPTAGPFVEARQVIVPYGAEQALHNIVDGSLRSRRSAINESDGWMIPSDIGLPITPRVAAKGRVYWGTQAGSVICLGAESP